MPRNNTILVLITYLKFTYSNMVSLVLTSYVGIYICSNYVGIFTIIHFVCLTGYVHISTGAFHISISARISFNCVDFMSTGAFWEDMLLSADRAREAA